MKTVLITGANGGLGFALSMVFHNAGYRLLLHSRCQIESLPSNAIGVTGDLTSPCTISNLADHALRMGVGVLINNAGKYLKKKFSLITDDEVFHTLCSNLTVPILLTKALWPCFRRQGGGQVFNIGSLAATMGGDGESIYSAAKAGLLGFSQSLQFDGTRDNVQITYIHLGAMRTPITQSRPLQGKLIDPFEVAKTILSLCETRDSMRTPEIKITRNNY